MKCRPIFSAFLSLCLSDACPEPVFYKMAQKIEMLFLTWMRSSGLRVTFLRKNGVLGGFSLCLSRACLGKMFVFIHKMAQKERFNSPEHASHDVILQRIHVATARTVAPFLEDTTHAMRSKVLDIWADHIPVWEGLDVRSERRDVIPDVCAIL